MMTHLSTLSLGLTLRSSLVGGATAGLSWVLESFSAAAMGQPDRLCVCVGGQKHKNHDDAAADTVNL